MRVGGDFRRGGLAGADGPDRLVGDHDFGELLRASSRRCRFWNWLDQHGFGLAALALFQALAHADDRRQPEFERGLRALEHGLVGLAEVLPAFAVADDGVGGARRRRASGRKSRR